ncbi:hypothetical protein Rxyl_2966 [Rubrobacter xylanophilus DSM 9941]|uniref:Alkaline shock response membrane anchor protein AmaP n=1 Tax=Rubrobacter xylanophilus (strain DSM 9941 / JCM 11954 / NBRC 16129 / PRD-1) TaxID=266117 RepID=Q1ARV2_RUBXD|nr:DUF6286 domain-containing protein [Rubrobacter xylanophilus]ABG05876.1 hypothetical protein Rxyl_2966 [Rubrobacter xylanophilus DSM 9941]
MRVFNRVVVTLLLVGLFVLGLVLLVYSAPWFGYRISELPEVLRLPSLYGGLEGLVSAAEAGRLSPLAIAALVLVALVGLILLLAELKPSRPRRVRMERGTYIARPAVAAEVAAAAESVRAVLGSSVKVKARRRPGALVRLEAHVRRGEELGPVREEIQRSVRERLARRGIPLGRLRLKLVESDPRQTRTRVK